MTRFPLALLVLTTLACGMTAPILSSDGQKGSATVNMATHVNTPITSNLAESVFVVTADSLHVRVFPQASARSVRFLVAGDEVMGFCYKFDRDEDGVIEEIWLGFERNPDGEPTKFAAVLFDGEWLMEGNCQ